MTVKYISTQKVLEKAGGASGLQKLLRRAGQPYPSYPTIGMWKVRNAIPSAWVGAILWAFACKGVRFERLLADTREPRT